MAMVLEASKAKIAKRVIEVFEYFDTNNRHATVMDIVREYGHPQSSTSELLAGLVEMGLLYKNPRSRTYTPTPRLATLGFSAQPEQVRNGHIFAFMDHLAQSSRHSVALFGMVGMHVQIFRWSAGAFPMSGSIGCGMSERLSDSAAGQLLIASMGAEPAGKILRRLNAEAPDDAKFNYSAMHEQVCRFGRHGAATGNAGFTEGVKLTAALVPNMGGERPLAVGVVYPADSAVDAGALVATLKGGLNGYRPEWFGDSTTPPPMMRAV